MNARNVEKRKDGSEEVFRVSLAMRSPLDHDQPIPRRLKLRSNASRKTFPVGCVRVYGFDSKDHIEASITRTDMPNYTQFRKQEKAREGKDVR